MKSQNIMKLSNKTKGHDIAPIISTLLDIPVPTSNIGVINPLFFQNTSLEQIARRMV